MRYARWLLCIAALAPALAAADPSGADDRLTLSLNGGSLTGTNGGAGGALGWLHNFDADTLLGLGVEHQRLGPAQWTFGSLNAGVSGGAPDARYTLAGEVHQGGGRDAGRNFHYGIEAIDLSGTYYRHLTVQLEDRQIDVEATHGNLPKVGVAYLWTPHLQTSLSYAYSFGGNLDTRLTTGRIDVYTAPVNLILGGGWGKAAGWVLGCSCTEPTTRFREGYAGLGKTLANRSEFTLIADYQDIGGSHRFTATLNYIVHLRSRG
ncbi:MAG: hypothetical protein JOZ03_00550 [Gammaproteobacteria bacterium]|nr:hypothetical protein [Gammaproteobacteria bacterium]